MPNNRESGFSVICDDCSHEFFQPISGLDTKALDPCPACGADSHFEPEQWEAIEADYRQALFNQAAEVARDTFRQIKMPKGWRKR